MSPGPTIKIGLLHRQSVVLVTTSQRQMQWPPVMWSWWDLENTDFFWEDDFLGGGESFIEKNNTLGTFVNRIMQLWLILQWYCAIDHVRFERSMFLKVEPTQLASCSNPVPPFSARWWDPSVAAAICRGFQHDKAAAHCNATTAEHAFTPPKPVGGASKWPPFLSRIPLTDGAPTADTHPGKGCGRRQTSGPWGYSHGGFHLSIASRDASNSKMVFVGWGAMPQAQPQAAFEICSFYWNLLDLFGLVFLCRYL